MVVEFLREVFEKNAEKDAIVWLDETVSYDWLAARMAHWENVLEGESIAAGTVAVIEADFSPNAVALVLALINHRAICVPLTSSVAAHRDEFIEIAEAQLSFVIDEKDDVSISRLGRKARHPHLVELRRRGHPGLVLFSSGSTGKNKAIVLDFVDLLEKFKTPRHSYRTITFLLYDHIGGVNTLLYSLSNAGCVITVEERSPDAVLGAVERHQVELLPTSPTFLNLVLLSEAYKRHDLSSLRTVTYGTEPMPEATLKRFHELFPSIKLLQTYGLSEVGILRSKSKASDSLWVKIGGEGFETRVVDGVLQIKAKSAMLGYLNAPSPFTENGWFDTGDAVEVNGEYMRILGRKSEIINVGGQKVYPTEVESVIQELDDVAEVTIYGEPHPIMGQIVCAKLRMVGEADRKETARRVRKHCTGRLPRYKVPVKVSIDQEKQHGERFKKKRPI